jgi:hypothetical protein
MKQKDIAMIIVVVVVSAILSIFISNAIFASPANRQQSVEVVQPLSVQFPTKSTPNYFNGDFDPTQLIKIGPSNNSNPFNTTGN